MTILLTGSTAYTKCAWLTIAVCSHPEVTLHFTSCLGARHNSQWISFTDHHVQIRNQPHHHPSVIMHHGCRPACSQLSIWLETMPLPIINDKRHPTIRRYMANPTCQETLSGCTRRFPRKAHHISFIILGQVPLKL